MRYPSLDISCPFPDRPEPYKLFYISIDNWAVDNPNVHEAQKKIISI